MSAEKKEKVKFVSEWPTLEKSVLTLLTWGNPIAWPAIFSGDYKESKIFKDWTEGIHSAISRVSPRTRA